MNPTPPLITLLTDFGEGGSYVGAMKGVMLGIAPDVRLVDISHQIAPQDIRQAASVLASVYRYFPPHTVHLIVVDPGVGGQRRPVAVETPGGRFVAPDNGVLTYVLMQEESHRAVVLKDARFWRDGEPSYTFHGRDIFSPVAAHLASGVALDELGPACDDLVRFPLPPLDMTSNAIRGEIIRVDRFGNALTDIAHLHWLDGERLEFRPLHPGPADDSPPRFEAAAASVAVGWHRLDGVRHRYGEAAPGHPLALVGSGGELEISVNQGSAQTQLGLKVGDAVTLYLGHPDR